MNKRTYISHLFRKARWRLGYSQEQLARKLGMSRSGVSRYENGNRMPSKTVLKQLKTLLGGDVHLTLAEVLSTTGK